MENNCAVILAGGSGRRMKSAIPKVLCNVLGKPMLDWVITACKDSEIDNICVVKGRAAAVLENHMEQKYQDKYQTVLQQDILGTGHAVVQAIPYLKNFVDGNTLVLNGDAPFIDSNTITEALKLHNEQDNAVTLITCEVENPYGYGRIIRNNGLLTKIVEQADCSANETTIHEINTGAYWFKTKDLLETLPKMNANDQGKIHLTQCIEIMLKNKKKAGTFITENSNAALGGGDRRSLLALNDIARNEVILRHLENGVEFVCSEGVVITPDVKIGKDTVIESNVTITGDTKIGENCLISEGCRLVDTKIGNNVTLYSVFSTEAEVEDNVKIGPWVQLRPNTHICKNVKIGDFVEIKNSTIGEKTAIAHLTYVGDSDVGSNVNFGCGVVTVNYNGIDKHRTVIGNNAFIGCNTNLIAPVKVGDYGYTAAGSTITQDVPDGDLAIERSNLGFNRGYGYHKLKIGGEEKQPAYTYDSATNDDDEKRKDSKK